MGQAVYIRGGSPFKAFLSIKGNSGDTVTITGPELNQTITLGSSASTVLVNKKGTYTLVANVANISTTIDVQERNKTYSADLSFKFTVTVTANPGVTVTLTTTSGNAYSYTGTANSSTGVATVTVYRKGSYSVSTNAATSGTVVASGSSTTVDCTTNNGSKSLYYIRVSDISAIHLAMYSSTQAALWWDQANSTYYTGVAARYTTGSYPASVSAGTEFGTGAGTSYQINASTKKNAFLKTGLAAGTLYYFSAWSYVTINGTKYYGTKRTAAWTRPAVSSSTGLALSGSGTWTVPEGVRSLTVFCVGGGGSGGFGTSFRWAGGGGGGGYCASKTFTVTPGQKCTYSVGAGGAAVASQNGARSPAGNSGSPTIFQPAGDTALTAGGGGCGATGYGPAGSDFYAGGNGGSGGGAPAWCWISSSEFNYDQAAKAGGSSGGAGGSSLNIANRDGKYYQVHGGAGQGSAAVTFNSTVYSGGGGGGGVVWNQSGAAGGTRGGGAGGGYTGNGGAGTAGTGGGGGGAGGWGNSSNSNNVVWCGAGGSGAIVINY